MDPAPPPSVGSMFAAVNTSSLLSDDEDEGESYAPAPLGAASSPLMASPMAAALHPRIAAAMRVVTRLRPDNPIEVFAGSLLGKPEPRSGGNREGGVAAFLTAHVTGAVTEAMTAALTAKPPPQDPAVFVAEYLMSKQ